MRDMTFLCVTWFFAAVVHATDFSGINPRPDSEAALNALVDSYRSTVVRMLKFEAATGRLVASDHFDGTYSNYRDEVVRTVFVGLDNINTSAANQLVIDLSAVYFDEHNGPFYSCLVQRKAKDLIEHFRTAPSGIPRWCVENLPAKFCSEGGLRSSDSVDGNDPECDLSISLYEIINPRPGSETTLNALVDSYRDTVVWMLKFEAAAEGLITSNDFAGTYGNFRDQVLKTVFTGLDNINTSAANQLVIDLSAVYFGEHGSSSFSSLVQRKTKDLTEHLRTAPRSRSTRWCVENLPAKFCLKENRILSLSSDSGDSECDLPLYDNKNDMQEKSETKSDSGCAHQRPQRLVDEVLSAPVQPAERLLKNPSASTKDKMRLVKQKARGNRNENKDS